MAEKSIFEIMNELIKLSDEKKRNYEEPKIYVSEKMHKWIKEYPQEFMDAYMKGVAYFCEVNGLV